jgi:triosephosphate isomerase
MKRSIIVGNWKMYATSIADAHVLATTVRNNLAHVDSIEAILCPPSLWLTEISHILGKSTKTHLGVQNMFNETEGAYTGEISPLMIKEIAKYVIIGHSERREYFGETNFDVNEKVISALKAGLTPIICVGEKKKVGTLRQPVSELFEALTNVPKKHYKDIIVAYEPTWAISDGVSGNNAEPEYAARVITKLREIVHSDTPILYGGSVNSSNTKGYAARPEIDGVLVGGASVRAAEFVKICKIWGETKELKNRGE